jgi:hypothetical protein
MSPKLFFCKTQDGSSVTNSTSHIALHELTINCTNLKVYSANSSYCNGAKAEHSLIELDIDYVYITNPNKDISDNVPEIDGRMICLLKGLYLRGTRANLQYPGALLG